MFSFLKNHVYKIGVDIGDDSLELIQLGGNGKGKGISLIAGGSERRPGDVKPGSSDWQRWAVETLRRLTAENRFRGKDVVGAMPASEVFIEHVKIPANNDSSARAKGKAELQDGKLQDAVFSKIKQKLPFEADDAMVKYIVTDEGNALVIAAERQKVDRHLAIYENANLRIKSISVWPIALANSYAAFFGRRKSDVEAIVMLLDMEANSTNVVICRHRNPLFARSIPVGVRQLCGVQTAGAMDLCRLDDEMVTRLVLELTGCRRHFSSMYRKNKIERLIFLLGQMADRNICATIAKKLEMPAQMGDCLAAVEVENPYDVGIDRRKCQVNWATAFGLSLS